MGRQDRSAAVPRATVDAFGVVVGVAADWVDHSQVRFFIPPESTPALHKAQSTTPVGGSVVISQHKLPERTGLVELLHAGVEELKRQDRSAFEVMTGTGRLGDLPAVWTELARISGEARIPIRQRRIAVQKSEYEVVIITLTGTARHVASLAQTMGFLEQVRPEASNGR